MYTTLEKLGLLFIAYVIYKVGQKILSFLFFYFAAPALNLSVDLKRQGKWAVITGATDGVGKAYAELLAKQGIDIVLISRTKSKLETVAAELQTKYKVNTKIIEADFSKGDEIYPHIEKELYGLEVGVLVNNVGLSYPYPEYFLALENKDAIYKAIIECNINAVLRMCQIVMPGMVEQRKGVVINISSATALFPCPLLAVYGASKSFVVKFSEDLATEYEKKGIIVQCVAPGFVATNMSKIAKPTWMAPSPMKYVSCALKTIGVQKLAIGYYPHYLMVAGLQSLQDISYSLSSGIVLRTHENIRARAIKKKEREAQAAQVAAQ